MKRIVAVYYPLLVGALGSASFGVIAKEYQDMSDPLAVYTQGGLGYTDKGINLKIGQSYDTGSDASAAMNIIELKGAFGDSLGFRDADQALYANVDDSVDSFRFRNFQVALAKGRGTQIDVSYSFDRETADASYSLIQALPAWRFIQLYPLLGLGVTVANDPQQGYEIPGLFSVVGFYSKFSLSEKVWLNYNPVYLATVSGSNDYKDNYYAGDSSIFSHEWVVSYQLNPRSNLRYFANWSEAVSLSDGDHRIEYNLQF